jgi:hypothetical protein
VLNKAILAVLFASLLLLGMPLEAAAQVNNPSPTEQANLNLVIRNIQSLIDGISGLGFGGTTQLGTSGFLSLDHLKAIQANLINLNNTHRIKSVPGLENGSAQYSEAGGNTEKAVAAYCPPGGYTTIRGQPCPGDTIIVDPHLLDPNHGTPLNENNIDDWTKKWDLASTLVHEKQHEMYVNDSLNKLHGMPWWPTDPKKTERNNTAIGQGLSPENHKQVYQIQKDTLKALITLLEHQKASTNSASVKQDLANKIKKIQGLLDILKEKEKKALGGGGLEKFESCGWPNDLHNGYLALLVTSPGVWERLDMQINNDIIIDQTITQTEWDGEYDLFSAVTNNPSLFITASEQTLFDLSVLDNSCEYYKQLIQTGDITTSSTSPVDFRFVPDWFKNPALWWSNDQTTNSEFANAIGFLVKKGIIFTDSKGVPISEVIVSDNITIPSWIKTNSNLWANNQISTDQFLQGVNYMLDNKIISFTPPTQVMQPGKVSIHVVDSHTGMPVYATVNITDLNGRTLQISTDQNGEADSHLPAGMYTVTINSSKYQQIADKIQVNGNIDKTYQMELLQQAPAGQYQQTGTPTPPSTTSSSYTISECEADGFWHVVSYDYSHTPPVKTDDHKTNQPCTYNGSTTNQQGNTSATNPPQPQTPPSTTSSNTTNTTPSSNTTKTTPPSNTTKTIPPSNTPPQVSTNPTTLSFTHLGMTSCPQLIGQVNLQSNQQGTWNVISNPTWTQIAIHDNMAQIIFNCQLSQYTQILSGDVKFQFTNNIGTTAMASVSISGQINQ